MAAADRRHPGGLLGVWASGYPGRSATLLTLWVGIGALIRGITQIVASFQSRKPHVAVASMSEPSRGRRLWPAIARAVAVGRSLLGACGGEIRAERQGKQFGEAICDVKKPTVPTTHSDNSTRRNAR